MRATFRVLCWKEFRELQWSVLAALGITLSLPLYARLCSPGDAYFWVLMMLVLYAVFGGLFFGMRAAAGERGSRGDAFLAALPVRAGVLGAVKLLATAAAALFPVLALALIGAAVQPLADHAVDAQMNIGTFAGICAAGALHIGLVTAVCGLGQRNELKAAACGLLVLASWWTAIMLLGISTSILQLDILEDLALVGLVLGSPLVLLTAPGSSGWPLGMVLLLIAALASTFVLRYGAALRPVVARRDRRTGTWVSPGLNSRWASLAVKEACETLPLALLVLGIAAVASGTWIVVALVAVVRDVARGQPMLTADLHRFAEIAVATFMVAACIGGFVLSLLLGIATFTADLEPRINTFWRSRPISPNQWFWTKYAAALASLLVTIGLPALIGAAVTAGVLGGPPLEATLPGISWIPLGWFGVFSAAVVSICLVRRPLYAGIFAVALAAAGLALAQWLDEGWFGGEPLKRPLLIAGVWLAASIAATFAGWWAAVRDVAVFE